MALKETAYCLIESEGVKEYKTTDGKQVKVALERIFVKELNQWEIRFTYYLENKNGKLALVPRPLDVPEGDLLDMFRDGVKNKVFSNKFRKELKRIL